MNPSTGTLQRRFLTLLALFMVLLLVCTAGSYMLLARASLTQLTLNSLNGELEQVTTLLQMYAKEEIPAYMLNWLFQSGTSGFLDGQLYVYNKAGDRIYPIEDKAMVLAPTDSVVRMALQGKTVSQTEFTTFYLDGIAMVGRRVDPSTDAYGAVFLIRNVKETGAAIRSLLQALAASLIAMILLFTIPMLHLIRSFVNPIGQMRSFSLAMTRGDFSRRLSEEYPGELGDLARSLNRLSARLYRALTDAELERNRLQEILNGLSEGIMALDEKGQVTTANPMLLSLCGVEEVPEHRIALIDDRTFWKGVDTCMRENIALTCTMRLHDKTLQATLTPLVTGKSLNQGAVCVLRDITEAVALEQTRRDYVANVSHELKTPVSNMRIISETLLDGMIRDPAELRRSYGTLLRESMRLSRLINDLLELSRLQSGTLYLEKTRTDPNALLEEIERQYAPTADDVGLDFLLEFPKGPCPEVYTNPDRASQIIVQLIANAIQYTPEGSITLSADYDQQKVYVHVRDTGVGIAPEDLPHVFERFYKVDRSHSSGGTGLGLSIAQELVSQMKETLTVTSRPGEGSCFTLSLERYSMGTENTQNP